MKRMGYHNDECFQSWVRMKRNEIGTDDGQIKTLKKISVNLSTISSETYRFFKNQSIPGEIWEIVGQNSKPMKVFSSDPIPLAITVAPTIMRERRVEQIKSYFCPYSSCCLSLSLHVRWILQQCIYIICVSSILLALRFLPRFCFS